MDDVPWLYVAMIFIAFVSWVWNQIKDAAEARREIVAERKRAQRKRNSTEPEYESPYRTAPGRENSGSSQPRTSPETVPEGPQSFRDIFREIERQLKQPEVEPEQPKSPPPLPTTRTVREAPAVPEAPPAYSFPTEVPEIKPTPPLAKVRRKKKRGNRETSNMLRGTLRDGAQLKNALILREVLGPPRSRQKRRV